MTTLLPAARLGSRKPRVSKFPTTASSAGQDAIDLAASAGLILDPWQQDILVASLYERPGGKWASFEVGLIVSRQSGKGSILEARELAGLFLFGESILHTSHEFKTSMDHYRRIERLVRGTPDLHRKVAAYPKAPGTEGIVMQDGRALRFMARTKGSGRGFPADVVILDEAFALTDEQLEALMPTMSARPNPQMWYTSSPPLDGEMAAPLFNLRRRGASPPVEGDPLCWFEWGAKPGADLDDRDVWAETNPAMGYRITEEFVARERAAMTDEGFGRERLGIWPLMPSETWGVITEADWLAAQDPDSQATTPLILAIDVTPDRSHAAIAVVGPRADGDLHGEIIDHRAHTDWVVARVKALVAKWKPFRVVVNPGGAGGSLIPELEFELVPSVYEELTEMKARDRAHAYGLFHQHVSSQTADGETPARRLHVRPSQALTLAVAGSATRRVEEGTVWDRRAESVDISPLVALTYALHGFAARPAPEVIVPPATAPMAPSPPFFRGTTRLRLGG